MDLAIQLLAVWCALALLLAPLAGRAIARNRAFEDLPYQQRSRSRER